MTDGQRDRDRHTDRHTGRHTYSQESSSFDKQTLLTREFQSAFLKKNCIIPGMCCTIPGVCFCSYEKEYYQMRQRRVWDRRNSTFPASWDTSIARKLRVLCDLIKNVSPFWGGQNKTAVELIESKIWGCANVCNLTYICWTYVDQQQYERQKLIMHYSDNRGIFYL